MPSRRRQQCCYREGRTRCRRDGTGNPVLCAPHRMVVEEQARRAEQPSGGLWSIVDDFLHGRPIDRSKVAKVVQDMMEPGPDPFEAKRSNHRRPVGERVYGAPVVDELAQKREALRQAKIALGFAADQLVTREQLKQRQRELAKRYHPDRPGGSLEKMQAVNSAVDLLEQAL